MWNFSLNTRKMSKYFRLMGILRVIVIGETDQVSIWPLLWCLLCLYIHHLRVLPTTVPVGIHAILGMQGTGVGGSWPSTPSTSIGCSFFIYHASLQPSTAWWSYLMKHTSHSEFHSPSDGCGEHATLKTSELASYTSQGLSPKYVMRVYMWGIVAEPILLKFCKH